MPSPERCQVCGRHPAKFVRFKAHQGFVVFRRELEYSGVFCRDHALEAYSVAQGKTLAGMWFSPASLVLGSVRAIFDTSKLLDLPDEVKDEPWVSHIVGCPHCGKKLVSVAGPIECANCRKPLFVCSCPACHAVQTSTARDVESIGFTCRRCGRSANCAKTIQNSPRLQVGQACAEVFAAAVRADSEITPQERSAFQSLVIENSDLTASAIAILDEHFTSCLKNPVFTALSGCLQTLEMDFIRSVLSLATAAAECDGPINAQEREFLLQFAKRCGIDLEAYYRSKAAAEATTTQWWEILEVSADASIEEIKFAYKRLVVIHHPDKWHGASDKERRTADERMKAINHAWEIAQQVAGHRRSSWMAPSTPQWSDAVHEPPVSDAARPSDQPSPTEQQPVQSACNTPNEASPIDVAQTSPEMREQTCSPNRESRKDVVKASSTAAVDSQPPDTPQNSEQESPPQFTDEQPVFASTATEDIGVPLDPIDDAVGNSEESSVVVESPESLHPRVGRTHSDSTNRIRLFVFSAIAAMLLIGTAGVWVDSVMRKNDRRSGTSQRVVSVVPPLGAKESKLSSPKTNSTEQSPGHVPQSNTKKSDVSTPTPAETTKLSRVDGDGQSRPPDNIFLPPRSNSPRNETDYDFDSTMFASTEVRQHYSVGIEAKNSRLFTKALKEFAAAIREDATFAPAYYYRGCVYESTDVRQALVEFSSAVERFLKFMRKVEGIAQAQPYLPKHHEERIRVFRSQFTSALGKRGQIYEDQSRFKEAEADFEKAISLEPENSVWHYCLAHSRSKEGRPLEALAGYARVLELAPSDADALVSRGVIYRKLADRNKSRDQYEQALAEFEKARSITKNSELVETQIRELRDKLQSTE
jgi:DnaJ-domain-containing protein 1